MAKERFQFLKNRLSPQSIDTLRSLYSPFKYYKFTKNELFLAVETKRLLFKQIRNDKFNRYDLIVNYLAIEQHHEINNYGFHLYKKMHRNRAKYRGDKNIKEYDPAKFLKDIADDIETNGYKYNSYLTVDKDLQLCDGAHRFSCALLYKIPVVPLLVLRRRTNIQYGIDFFDTNGFTREEVEIIENKKNEIFANYMEER